MKISLLLILGTAVAGMLTSNAADVLGDRGNIGYNHTLSGTAATITGGSNNVASATLSTVSGGYGNSVTAPGAFIGGGVENSASGTNSVIAGGEDNTNTSSWGVVGGGYGNLMQDAYGVIAGGWGNIDLGYYSTIAGGAYSIIGSNGAGGFIGGGSYNSQNGEFGVIGGGTENTNITTGTVIGGGFRNSIANTSAYESVIAGGSDNYIGGLIPIYSTISGGYSNRVERGNGTIGGGRENLVQSNTGTIPGGLQAKTVSYGQQAYANGSFSAQGDAQTSIYVARQTTINSTQTEIFLDGSAARIQVSSGATFVFEAQIVGRNGNGDSAGYLIRGVMENVSGTTALVGTTDVSMVREDVGSWDATVEADDTHDALVIKVTGDTSSIRWVATVRTTEVKQ
jgi:hypothetical protein